MIFQVRSAGSASTSRSITQPAGGSQLMAGRQDSSKEALITYIDSET
jgi:hypothetical protein